MTRIAIFSGAYGDPRRRQSKCKKDELDLIWLMGRRPRAR
jgi:hypothetical protein